MSPVNLGCTNLSVEVSTMTSIQERIGRYTMPGVCLRMLEGDARVMMEDEVVLNTTLNLAMRPLSGTRREFSEKHIKLNSTYDGGFFSHPFSP